MKTVPFISYGLVIFLPAMLSCTPTAHVNSAEEAGECSVCPCGAALSLCAVASVKSPSGSVTRHQLMENVLSAAPVLPPGDHRTGTSV